MVRNMPMNSLRPVCMGIVLFAPLAVGGCQRSGNRSSIELTEGPTLAQLAQAYRRAINDRQKRDIVISAIDKGLIRVGGALGVVREVCTGDRLGQGWKDETGVVTSVVHFIPVRGTDPLSEPICDGWTFAVRHAQDRICGFSLSDTQQVRGGPYPGYDTYKRYTAEQLASAYRVAVDDRARRDIVIAAMDSDLVRLHGPLDALRQICGDDFDEGLPDERDVLHGLVDFGRRKAGESGTGGGASQQGRDTWYLKISHFQNRIMSYSLSNVRDGPFQHR